MVKFKDKYEEENALVLFVQPVWEGNVSREWVGGRCRFVCVVVEVFRVLFVVNKHFYTPPDSPV